MHGKSVGERVSVFFEATPKTSRILVAVFGRNCAVRFAGAGPLNEAMER